MDGQAGAQDKAMHHTDLHTCFYTNKEFLSEYSERVTEDTVTDTD